MVLVEDRVGERLAMAAVTEVEQQVVKMVATWHWWSNSK